MARMRLFTFLLILTLIFIAAPANVTQAGGGGYPIQPVLLPTPSQWNYQDIAIGQGSMVVGSSTEDNMGRASFYRFVDNFWFSAGSFNGDLPGYCRYGSAVAIQGNTAVVGAPGDIGFPYCKQGKVYIYQLTSSNFWELRGTLTPQGSEDYDLFGYSVAISPNEDAIVVGAILRDIPDGYSSDEGAVFRFERPSGGWTTLSKESQVFYPPEGQKWDRFGESVAVRNNILVGAPGAGARKPAAYYIYNSGFGPTAGWRMKQLSPDDLENQDGFGSSVALGPNEIIVGSPSDDVGVFNNRGSVYVFPVSFLTVFSPPSIGDPIKLGPDPAINSNGASFGSRVSYAQETLLVGAPDTLTADYSGQGRAYVFHKPPTGWADAVINDSFVDPNVPGPALSTDHFGTTVATNGNVHIFSKKPANGVGSVHTEAPVLSLSGFNLKVKESGPGTIFLVALGKKPNEPVTVRVAAPDRLTLNPITLTFNMDNWNEPQPVLINASSNHSIAPEPVYPLVLNTESTDGRMSNYTSRTIHINVTNSDSAIFLPAILQGTGE